MTSFGIFQKMNQKLEEGWKLTNVNCPLCQTSILGRLDTKEMYCVKCEMPVKMQTADEDEEEDQDDVEVIGSGSKGSPQQEDDFDNMVIQRQMELKRQRSDELSKKMGEKLLQGWAMLEETCFDCLFPLMRSRKGEIICVGCGPVKEKKPVEEEKVPENKIASPELKTVKTEANKQEEKVVQKPVEQPKVTKTEEVPQREEKTKEKKEKREKKEEKRKEHKREKSHKKFHKGVYSQSRNTEDVHNLLELGNFDESLSLYSKMNALLHTELDRVSQEGLTGNVEKVWEILALQKKIDKTKVKIVKKLAQ